MADLEKFVLTYEVDSKEAAARLESLQKQWDGMTDKSKKKMVADIEIEKAQAQVESLKKKLKDLPPEKRIAYKLELENAEKNLAKLQGQTKALHKEGLGKLKEGFKKFGEEAGEELSKVVPGLEGVTGAIGMMGGAFAVVSVGVAAVAVGIKSVIDLQATYERQRKAGMEVGVSGMRMEEYERKFVKSSGGRVSREETQENVKAFADKLRSAFANPDPYSVESRQLRLAGISARGAGGHLKGTNEALAELGRKFKGMTEEQVQGMAPLLGISRDFALALKQQGASVGEITELTTDEILKRKQSEQEMKEYNAATAKLKEAMTEAEQAIGQEVIPALTDFVQWVTKLANAIPDVVKGIKDWYGKMADYVDPSGLLHESKNTAEIKKTTGNTTADTLLETGKIITNIGRTAFDPFNATVNATAKANEDAQAKHDAALKNALGDKAATPENIAAAEGKLKEDVAKADAETAKKKKEEADQFLKSQDEQNKKGHQIQADNERAINMFVGAVASFANAIDEQQAIAAWAGEVGAASGIAAPGSAPSAANTAPPGKLPSPSQFAVNSATAAPQGSSSFPPFTGAGAATTLPTQAQGFKGESRERVNVRNVQANIANRLGVPLEQLQMGGANRGDVAWSVRQLEAEYQNNIQSLKIQLARGWALPGTEQSRLRTQIFQQEQGLHWMEKFGGDVTSRAREGGRSITVGERAIVVNVHGVSDPAAAGAAAADHVKNHLEHLVNQSATSQVQ